MKYYPISMNLNGRPVLVVGAGKVAWRKVQSLRKAGAVITVVSPKFCRELQRMKGITRIKRCYRKADLARMCLVICATDSSSANRRVYDQAVEKSLPINVVDQPALCTFTVPAVLSQGELMIAISTGGASPAFSGRLRRELARLLDPALAQQVSMLRRIRKDVLASGLTEVKRSRVLKRLASAEFTGIIKKRGLSEALSAARRLVQRMSN